MANDTRDVLECSYVRRPEQFMHSSMRVEVQIFVPEDFSVHEEYSPTDRTVACLVCRREAKKGVKDLRSPVERFRVHGWRHHMDAHIIEEIRQVGSSFSFLDCRLVHVNGEL